MRQLRPSALGFGIFEGSAAGLVGLPIAHEHIFVFGPALVQDVAAITSFREYGGKFANRGQSFLLMSSQRNENRDGKDLFGHFGISVKRTPPRKFRRRLLLPRSTR